MANKKKVFGILRPLLLGLVLIGIAGLITQKLFFRAEIKKDAIQSIRERGFLIALTDQNTLNYFVLRGAPMGYQLEMLQSLAKSIGVPLRIIASNNVSKLLYYLENNAADVVALNLPMTSHGRKLGRYTEPMGETRLVLVQRKSSGNKKDTTVFVTDLKQFPADTVFVNNNPFFDPLYHAFEKKTHNAARLKRVSDKSQEELIKMVSKGEINYALCQENIAMVCKRNYWNVDASLLAFSLFSYAWAVNTHSDSLQTVINNWLEGYKTDKSLKKNYLSYFDNQRIVAALRSDYLSICGNRLSPYDKEIKEYSKWINWDWRLLASLIYEESNFIPGQISSRSASGLMQLMPETAAKFGADSSSSAAQQIAAGVRYIRYLDEQLPEEILSPVERIYFALASYNIGINRVLGAREKAGNFGKDKNRWNGHVDYHLLRRSKSDPYAKSDTGSLFPTDHKMEGFVDDIITRYFHYKNLIPE